jgi:hypothetical protein
VPNKTPFELRLSMGKLRAWLFYAESGFFDGNIRFFGRIGSKPFLWFILKT